MGLLDKIFGRSSGGPAVSVDSAVETMLSYYDHTDVKLEGGVSITGPEARIMRDLGRSLHKGGGKAAMEAAREGVRAKTPWAVKNLEAIWSGLPEWKN
jgi:hypothetical protein